MRITVPIFGTAIEKQGGKHDGDPNDPITVRPLIRRINPNGGDGARARIMSIDWQSGIAEVEISFDNPNDTTTLKNFLQGKQLSDIRTLIGKSYKKVSAVQGLA